MGGKRVMIICGPDNVCVVESALTAAGARVEHRFELLGGLCARVTPQVLMQLLEQNPELTVFPDARLYLPPLPLQRDQGLGAPAVGLPDPAASGPQSGGPAAATSPLEPGTAPEAVRILQADKVRALGLDGSGVRICIIDSGVDFAHPDLAGTALTDSEGRLLAADFTGTDLTDTLGHGTAVAGNIASQGRQVYQVADPGLPPVYHRIVGIAPGVRLMSAKVFDTRVPGVGGWESSIIAALEWAVQNGAHIVNMSLGGANVPNNGVDAVAMAVATVRARGVAVFCAAGNEGSGDGSISSPGSGIASIGVGATTAYRSFGEINYLAAPGKFAVDQMAGFSSHGPTTDGRIKPDLCSPGAFDWSLAPAAGSEEGTLFQLFGGTSQATPMAVGAAALVWQAFRQQHGRAPTPDELLRMLVATADDLGYPATAQGVGRINALRAVEAALDKGTTPLLEAADSVHGITAAGHSRAVTLRLRNPGSTPLQLQCRATVLQPDARSYRLVGMLNGVRRDQQIEIAVPAGVELLHVQLCWTGTAGTTTAPRAVIALYDPAGNFVNYQNPAAAGEAELGRTVETWAARPQTGTWTARMILRPTGYQGELPYSLTVNFMQRRPWSWARMPRTVTIAAGQAETLTCQVAVPELAPAGQHEARLEFEAGGRNLVVPVAVSVPVSISQGVGTFSGHFRHGHQGSYQSGDWRTYPFKVPAGTRTLAVAVHWPDAHNTLRAYLIDPDGNAVLGKSGVEATAAGQPGPLGHELVYAGPRPGWWQLILHSAVFSGRSEPEPFHGRILLGPEMAQPRELRLIASPGARVPVALGVHNPGWVPLEVFIRAQTPGSRLQTREFKAELHTGLDASGQGSGLQEAGPFTVPPGARLLAAYVTWDQPGVEVALTLIDPLTNNILAFAGSRDGQALAVVRNPAPGNWILALSSKAPGNPASLTLQGGWILQAPTQLNSLLASSPTLLLPGATALVPGWLTAPANLREPLQVELRVMTREGDQLAAVPARLQPAAPAGRRPRRRPGSAPPQAPQ